MSNTETTMEKDYIKKRLRYIDQVIEDTWIAASRAYNRAEDAHEAAFPKTFGRSDRQIARNAIWQAMHGTADADGATLTAYAHISNVKNGRTAEDENTEHNKAIAFATDSKIDTNTVFFHAAYASERARLSAESAKVAAQLLSAFGTPDPYTNASVKIASGIQSFSPITFMNNRGTWIDEPK